MVTYHTSQIKGGKNNKEVKALYEPDKHLLKHDKYSAHYKYIFKCLLS